MIIEKSKRRLQSESSKNRKQTTVNESKIKPD